MQQETLDRLHSRYLVQATWTALIREQLFDSIQIRGEHKLLEVGCGTGVISAEITRQFQTESVGVDLDQSVVTFAHNIDPESHISQETAAIYLSNLQPSIRLSVIFSCSGLKIRRRYSMR